MHVFTYGTLMFPEVWNAVAGRAYSSVDGTLRGFAIYTVRDAVFPGIIAANQSDHVRGVVYLDVDDDSLARLDLFEDDFYRREALSIDCSDGQARTAHAYVVPAENRAILSDQPWRRDEFVTSGGLEQFIRRFQGFSRLGTPPSVA
jgi:gamma-glutamylcyclotransferase (GGCT)/AIG2-like uncharacterized protein YtfP